MLSQQEKKKLVENLKKLNRDISDIRKELNILNESKEEAFLQKDGVSKNIATLRTQVRTLRRDRDGFTKQIRELKKKRKELRERVNSKITEFKEMDKERKALMQKHKIKVPPVKIREAIEKLETKIEVEALPFSEEKKLMKKIKDMKKQLGDAGAFGEVFDRSQKLSKAIDEDKALLEKTHSKIQELAKKGQEKHEKMIELSKEVKKLREQEDSHKQSFLEQKDQFNKVNNRLKEVLLELNVTKKKLDEHKQETKKKDDKRIEEELKQKEIKIEEKIKKGGKLTTEDLLVFQRQSKEDEKK